MFFVGLYNYFSTEIKFHCEKIINNFLQLEFYPIETEEKIVTRNKMDMFSIFEQEKSVEMTYLTNYYYPQVESLSRLLDIDLISAWRYNKIGNRR